jgi:DNA-binding transcriptional LysR family regulator
LTVWRIIFNHRLMATLSGIESFVRSAEAGSFSAAARRLGLTSAAVSKNVAKLEEDLGIRLFQRSTRRLSLTEAGRLFLGEVGGGLAAIRGAVDNVASAGREPEGQLRVSMSPGFGLEYIVPLLGELCARYPKLVPDWHFENRQVDLIGEGFDAAIGGGFALAPGLVARELTRLHLVACAAPSFLGDRKAPRTPAELAALDGVMMRSGRTGKVVFLTLQDRNGRQQLAEQRTRVIVSDPEAATRCTLLGLGIGVLPMPHVAPHLERGALVRVLPGWHADFGSISLYYAGSKLLPAKTRAFVDAVLDAAKRGGFAKRFTAV